jgi:hypothetical protein
MVVIAVAVGRPKSESGEKGSPLSNIFTWKKVDPLLPKEAESLITAPVGDTFSYDKKAIKQILEITNGKPWDIQYLCRSIIEELLQTGRRQATVEDVLKVKQQIGSLEDIR